jgi:hypothetical protein
MTKTTLNDIINIVCILVLSVLMIMLTLERNNLKLENQQLKAQIQCKGIWHQKSLTCFKK